MGTGPKSRAVTDRDRVFTVDIPPAPVRFGWPHHNPFGPAPARAALALDFGDRFRGDADGDAGRAGAARPR